MLWRGREGEQLAGRLSGRADLSLWTAPSGVILSTFGESRMVSMVRMTYCEKNHRICLYLLSPSQAALPTCRWGCWVCPCAQCPWRGRTFPRRRRLRSALTTHGSGTLVSPGVFGCPGLAERMVNTQQLLHLCTFSPLNHRAVSQITVLAEVVKGHESSRWTQRKHSQKQQCEV